VRTRRIPVTLALLGRPEQRLRSICPPLWLMTRSLCSIEANLSQAAATTSAIDASRASIGMIGQLSESLWSPNEGFSGEENRGNLENVPKKARRRRRRRPCPPQAFAGGVFFKRAHGKVEFACSRAAGMQSPAAPRIWPGGTLAMSGSHGGGASTPPATGTELSRLPSNRPDPKADHDKGPSPAAGYVGVCYISVTMVHHC
jgi:hypothetical protein